MKKTISLLLAALLVVGSLTACGNGNTTDTGSKNPTETGSENTSETGSEVKVGIGVHTDFSYGSYNYGEGQYSKTDGNGQADITMAAVALDADGKT